MQALADLLRDAVNRQVLTEDDLYRTEPFVIQKLEADPASARRWRRFRRFCRVERSADGRRTDSGSGFPPSCGTSIHWWRVLAASPGWTPGCGRPRRLSWPRTSPAGSAFRRKPPERMIERLGERDMDYREKAVRCVRETVLPVQAAQFRECGCDLDAQYRKYGDTEGFLPRSSSPGASMRWAIPNASAPRCCGERRPTPPTANVPGRACCIFWNSCCPKTHHGADRGDGAGRRDLLPLRRHSGVAGKNANRSPVLCTGLLRSRMGIIPRPGACPRPPGRSDRTPASRRSWGR